ncbi:MAG TPA: hypothetical protein PKJ33_02680 [Alphaproteobacteria bacterium]|nr:hypothetical protein [Alphaproteobacteria bacterium]
MKKIWSFALCCIISISFADASQRTETSINREPVSTSQRTATVQKESAKVNSRTGSVREVSVRNSSNTLSRSAVTTPRKNTTISARSATTTTKARTTVTRNVPVTKNNLISRTTTTTSDSKTFGSGYNACRDSYFTCMDQFCAKQDETYQRCACSSRLEEIKSKERALSQTKQQLQDFKDLNIDSISKTRNEVKAMVNASAGESATDKSTDTSSSSEKLSGISSVLSKTKSESLSTQGKLDIAGNINAIWSTTDLTAGADIMNLTGEKLYNAVHAQCVSFASDSCDSKSTLNMVVTAYGMYIENDCTTLSNSLAKQTTNASGSIRETEQAMNQARLENYDSHNSTSINDCISNVRKDITADSACGKDYIHCLDITGKYLNSDTGEPIYSSDFYQLELQTSLSGDILTNQTNRLLVNELNKKKEFVTNDLSKCSDLSSDVWDEFMRQAITEIYQGQQERIREVKNECIDVVNDCYDTQSKSLKDFSNVKEQLLLGSRLELSEEMCKEKLNACSNLYGGGEPGLEELVTTMHNITDQKIAKDCKTTLEDYAKSICAVPSSDIVHGYPFACRTYAPGEQKYASISSCNLVFSTGTLNVIDTGYTAGVDNGTGTVNFICRDNTIYTNCSYGYYMAYLTNGFYIYDGTPKPGNKCLKCPTLASNGTSAVSYNCNGGTEAPAQITNENTSNVTCGDDYVGSLYQKIVRYALQTCTRPSDSTEVLPYAILADVNVVMDSIKSAMGTQLSDECERLGGIWVNTPGNNVSSDKILTSFYTETSSNKKWGYCSVTPAIVCPKFSTSDSSCVSTDSSGVSGGCAIAKCRCVSGTYSNGSGGCTPGTYSCQGACGTQRTTFTASSQTPVTTAWTGGDNYKIRRKYSVLCSNWITVSGGTCTSANFTAYYTSCLNDNNFTTLVTCD